MRRGLWRPSCSEQAQNAEESDQIKLEKQIYFVVTQLVRAECSEHIAQGADHHMVEKKLTSYGTLMVRVYVADAFDVGHLLDVAARSAEIEKAFRCNSQTTLASAANTLRGRRQ